MHALGRPELLCAWICGHSRQLSCVCLARLRVHMSNGCARRLLDPELIYGPIPLLSYLPVPMEADLPWAWELLREIGTGESSVKKAVRHAKKSAATADPGGLDPDLAAPVRIGGGHEKHAERALWRWVANQPWRRLLPDLYTFGCTKWQGPTKGVCAAEHSALLPREVVARLAVACPELFQQVMGSQSSWAEFWAGEGLDEAALTVATAAATPRVEAGAQDRGGPAHGPGAVGQSAGSDRQWGAVATAAATPTVDTGARGGTAHGPGAVDQSAGSAAGPGHTVMDLAARGAEDGLGTTDSGVAVATARSSSQRRCTG